MKNAKIRIKTGDTVKVLQGKDKGKTGTVTQVFPEMGKIVIDGINKMIKHLASPRRDEKGQRIDFFGPVHISNVALVCPKCNKATRVAYHIATGEDGTKQKSRQCKKCNETF